MLTPTTNGVTTVTAAEVIAQAKLRVGGLEAASTMLTAGKQAADILAALALLNVIPAEELSLQDQLKAALEENAKLRAAKAAKQTMTLKVSEKGAVSVYGLGRFPVTLYQEQFIRLLDASVKIREFITANKGSLTTKAIV